MIKHIKTTSIIEAQGNKPKLIEEFIGQVNSQTENVSIARMKSPPGWIEPGQTPEFDEYTVVLQGMLRVKSKKETIDVKSGEAIIVEKVNGSSTARPPMKGLNTLQSVFRHFHPAQCIGTKADI